MAPLEHLRSESVTLVSSLIYDKPELEAQLLSILMHKLGDKSKKLGSKVAFLISKLMVKHPRMKRIVLREASREIPSRPSLMIALCLGREVCLLDWNDNSIRSVRAASFQLYRVQRK